MGRLERFRIFLESVGGVDNPGELTDSEHFFRHLVFIICTIVLIIAFMIILGAGLMLVGYKTPPNWLLSFDYIILPFLATTAWVCAMPLNRYIWKRFKARQRLG